MQSGPTGAESRRVNRRRGARRGDQPRPIRRRDVLDQLGPSYGLEDPNLGFLLHFPGSLTPGEPAFLEIETRAGQLARLPVPTPGCAPLAAIRRLLELVELP